MKANVTVALPVRNAARSVERSIRSILWQDFEDFELLILDDGSTDESLEICGSFQDARVRVVADGRSLGLARRLNQAVAVTTTPYFARMDADDVAFPERLRLQLELLETDKQVDLCGSSILWIDEANVTVKYIEVPVSHDEIMRAPWRPLPLFHPTWLGRTEWFRKNTYDESLSRSQDAELLLRTAPFSRFANVCECLLAYDCTGVAALRSAESRRTFSRLLAGAGTRNGDPRLLLSAAAYRIASAPLAYRLSAHVRKPAGSVVPDHVQQRWTELSSRLRDTAPISA